MKAATCQVIIWISFEQGGKLRKMRVLRTWKCGRRVKLQVRACRRKFKCRRRALGIRGTNGLARCERLSPSVQT